MKRVLFPVLVTTALLVYIGYHVMRLYPDLGGALTIVAACWIAFHVVGSALNRRHAVPPSLGERRDLEQLSVALVVCVHNEDPAWVRACADSVARQTHQPDELWMIDDGSAVPVEPPPGWKFHRFDSQRGKRAALAHAFRGAPNADVWVTVDSDSVLEDDAVASVVVPLLRDDRVMAVAGRAYGYNWDTNLLTRLIDVEFSGSFFMGRALQGLLGGVLTTCGVLAAYDGRVIRAHLEEFENETFWSKSVAAGDDRSLTQFACLHGKAVYAEAAGAATALPENLGHLRRQRIRWSRSFYRAISFAYKRAPMKGAAFWLILMQVVMFATFGLGSIWAVFFAPLVARQLLVGFLFYSMMVSYLRSIRYLSARRELTVSQRIGNWMLSPLIGLLYAFLLTPCHLYAGFTCRGNRGWMTRKKVEVHMHDADPEGPARR